MSRIITTCCLVAAFILYIFILIYSKPEDHKKIEYITVVGYKIAASLSGINDALGMNNTEVLLLKKLINGTEHPQHLS